MVTKNLCPVQYCLHLSLLRGTFRVASLDTAKKEKIKHSIIQPSDTPRFQLDPPGDLTSPKVAIGNNINITCYCTPWCRKWFWHQNKLNQCCTHHHHQPSAIVITITCYCIPWCRRWFWHQNTLRLPSLLSLAPCSLRSRSGMDFIIIITKKFPSLKDLSTLTNISHAVIIMIWSPPQPTTSSCVLIGWPSYLVLTLPQNFVVFVVRSVFQSWLCPKDHETWLLISKAYPQISTHLHTYIPITIVLLFISLITIIIFMVIIIFSMIIITPVKYFTSGFSCWTCF